uniref:Putative secreted protein n=1 Tax=Anopheles triannulatus TaxID=58253 RepID=A0A2M4B5G5_9DIPT
MSSSFTMLLCFTFRSTSNSRICTSGGRMWLSWLNVFTATGSPLCLFTPWNTAPVAPLPSTLVVHQT